MSRRKCRKNVVRRNSNNKPTIIEEKPKGFFAKLKDVACNAGTSVKLGTLKVVYGLKIGALSTGRFGKERVLALKETISDLFMLIRNFRQIQDEALVLAKLMTMNNDKSDTIDRLSDLRKRMLEQVVTIDKAIKLLKEQPEDSSDAVGQTA